MRPGASAARREIEIKLQVPSATEARRRLRRAGFHAITRSSFEANEVFDSAAGGLRASQRLLRLREYRGRFTLTYKGAPEVGAHHSREEIETQLENPGAMRLVLERLGYQCIFRYEKYRCEWKAGRSPFVATLDETPIGVFLELEGSPVWIDRMARKLGFSAGEYLTRSYSALYLEECARNARFPGHMVFPK